MTTPQASFGWEKTCDDGRAGNADKEPSGGRDREISKVACAGGLFTVEESVVKMQWIVNMWRGTGRKDGKEKSQVGALVQVSFRPDDGWHTDTIGTKLA